MGYSDVQQMVIATLMGRDPGTEIQPEDHQEYALALLDYARSIELAGASALMGVATVTTIPVQPSGSSVFYLANLASGTTYTFSNFYDSSGNAIQITTSTAEVGFATLIWNTASWSSEVTTYTSSEEVYLEGVATKALTIKDNNGSAADKKIWTGTDTEYDELGEWDSNTLYFVL